MVSDSQFCKHSHSHPLQQKRRRALGGGRRARGANALLRRRSNRRQPGDVRHDPLEARGWHRPVFAGPAASASWRCARRWFRATHVLILARSVSVRARGVLLCGPHRRSWRCGASRQNAPFSKGSMHRVLILGRRQIRRIDSGLLAESGSTGSTGRYRRDRGGGGGARQRHGQHPRLTLDATNAWRWPGISPRTRSMPSFRACRTTATSGSPQPPAKRAHHYFDLTERCGRHALRAHLAAGAGEAFVPQCGLAPGSSASPLPS